MNCPACQKPLLVPAVGDETALEAVDEQPQDSHTQDDRAQETSPAPQEEPEESEEVSIQFRKPQTVQEGMDLTPMVDVTFLLLIFFMITASFTIQSKLNWAKEDPDDEAGKIDLVVKDMEKVAVMVNIDEKNEITVDDELVSDLSQLRDMIEKQMRAERKTMLMLQVHAMALHEYSIKVVDAAKGAGIQRINYATTGSLDTE